MNLLYTDRIFNASHLRLMSLHKCKLFNPANELEHYKQILSCCLYMYVL